MSIKDQLNKGQKPSSDFESPEEEFAYNNFHKNLTISGFRPGKVPRSLALKLWNRIKKVEKERQKLGLIY